VRVGVEGIVTCMHQPADAQSLQTCGSWPTTRNSSACKRACLPCYPTPVRLQPLCSVGCTPTHLFPHDPYSLHVRDIHHKYQPIRCSEVPKQRCAREGKTGCFATCDTSPLHHTRSYLSHSSRYRPAPPMSNTVHATPPLRQAWCCTPAVGSTAAPLPACQQCQGSVSDMDRVVGQAA
jgi:hypothetical protein